MALSAREKAEAARYKPAKKKEVKKPKKKVDMRSAREKAEASYVPKKKSKTAVSTSLRPKAKTYKVSTTTVQTTPTVKNNSDLKKIQNRLNAFLKKLDADQARLIRKILKQKKEARRGSAKTNDRFSGMGADMDLIMKMLK